MEIKYRITEIHERDAYRPDRWLIGQTVTFDGGEPRPAGQYPGYFSGGATGENGEGYYFLAVKLECVSKTLW